MNESWDYPTCNRCMNVPLKTARAKRRRLCKACLASLQCRRRNEATGVVSGVLDSAFDGEGK